MNPTHLLSRVILFGLGIWALYHLVVYFGDVLAYVSVSVVIWFMLTPLVNFLDYTGIRGKSLPRWLAAALGMAIFVGLFVLLGTLFFPVIVEQASVLASIDQNELIKAITDEFTQVETWLSNNGMNLQQEVGNYIDKVNIFGSMQSIAETTLSVAGNLIVAVFAVTFISFFFLKDESLVKRIIVGATPNKYMNHVNRVLSNAKKLLSRYFLGLAIQVTLIATMVTIGMSIIGVENAFLIGFFAGFINVIPYIGPIIGSAFGLFIVFTTQIEAGIDDSTGTLMLYALLVFVVVQVLDNFVFQPLIFSNSVNAHPLEIFLIIFIAGTLGGVLGMICAIPAYTLIRIIAKEFLTQFKVVQNLTKNI